MIWAKGIALYLAGWAIAIALGLTLKVLIN